MAKADNGKCDSGVSTRQRNFLAGEAYHVYQRGNHGKRTFLSVTARLRYLRRLFELAKEHGVRVHGFCLMANHIHFVLEPESQDSISNLMKVLQQVHAREHNLQLKKSGNLWQQHFGCKHIDSQEYYFAVMKYVELNPVLQRRAASAVHYLWSSAAAHAAGAQVEIAVDGDSLVTNLDLEAWRKRVGELGERWAKYLLGREWDASAMEKIQAMLDGRRRQAMAQKHRAQRRREMAIESKTTAPNRGRTRTAKQQEKKVGPRRQRSGAPAYTGTKRRAGEAAKASNARIVAQSATSDAPLKMAKHPGPIEGTANKTKGAC